jgi:hypothetical protein
MCVCASNVSACSFIKQILLNLRGHIGPEKIPKLVGWKKFLKIRAGINEMEIKRVLQ